MGCCRLLSKPIIGIQDFKAEPSYRSLLISPSRTRRAEADLGETSIGHFPGDRWEFDDTVARIFDDMLARSIPHINSMREAVLAIGGDLIQPHSDVLDLGCACGNAMAAFIPGRE